MSKKVLILIAWISSKIFEMLVSETNSEGVRKANPKSLKLVFTG